jgi:heat shock protein HslJ
MKRISGRTMAWWLASGFSVVTAALLAATAGAFAQAEFPFDHELLLDARPLPGSKRIPILEISADGRAQIDLWCRSGAGQVAVTGMTIKFTLGPMREQACTPERAQRDEEMAVVLSEVSRWRREGDVVVLVGPRELRFHLSSH